MYATMRLNPMVNALSRISAFLCIAASLCITQVAVADEELKPSPLRDLIVDYIKFHPDASLAEVAAFANARLPENGIDYEFAIGGELMTKSSMLLPNVFEAGSRRLLSGGGVDLGDCGILVSTVPAVLRARPDAIDLVHRGEILTVLRPDGVLIETMTIYSADQQTILGRIEAPWRASPRGVLPDGSGVILEFSLRNGVFKWWQRVRAANAQITRYDSYLLLQVDAQGVEFIGDPDRYGDERAERVADFHSNGFCRDRVRFPGSGLVVEY